MKILLINRMMGISWGGGENYDFNLASALRGLGHDVTILTGQTPPGQPLDHIGAVPAVAVATPYLRKYTYLLAGKVRLLPGIIAEADLHWFRAACLRKIKELAAGERFDLIQMLALPFLARDLVRRRFRVAMRFPGPPAWFHGKLLHRLAEKHGVAMFSSGDTVRYFDRSLGLRIPEIPPGVETRLYRPAEGSEEKLRLRQELNIGGDEFLLVSVGRLVAGKGHDFLLSAFARAAAAIPRLRLAVVGGGPLSGRLEKKASGLGISGKLRFTGHLGRGEVARYLRASDLFCLFSDYENYSNAVLEAMSAGLPVLATRVGGFPLQIEDGANGFLITPGSIPEFLDRLERIVSSPDLERHLSTGARAFASRFSWEHTARRATEVYEQLLSR
jgi:glycosyltransferase involved in cell wall biosynthesis